MTLQELRYLVALAEQGHFVRAAEMCHVGQPTLSIQLKKLEDHLGVTLFERNKHLMQPTPVGEEIVERARQALAIVEEIHGLAASSRVPMNGPLRLGVIPTLGPYLMPRLLPKLRERYPRLRLFLREDLTANLLDRLRQGRLDALLLALPLRGEDLEVMALFREPFEVAMPPGHRLAAQRHVEEGDLAREEVLLLEEGHCIRDQALAICGGASSEQREELKATSIETLRQMVAAGIGCTLLPKLAALPGVGSLQNGLIELRPFAPPVPSRTVGMVWRPRFPRASTVVGLGELILEQVAPLVEPLPCNAERTARTAAPAAG